MLLDPLPCHKLSHLLGPPPPIDRDVLYRRPLMRETIGEEGTAPFGFWS